jgi:ubiquitin fusion degradation protein 1
VEIEKVCPVKGTYIKLRPHETAFINLHNPKAVLEKIMSKDYPVVTEGQTIEIFYEELKKTFRIDIVKAEPAEIISIINTDINVDFDTPCDYVEPKKTPPPTPPSPKMLSPGNQQNKIISRRAQIEDMQSPTTKSFIPFSGQGHRLGDK